MEFARKRFRNKVEKGLITLFRSGRAQNRVPVGEYHLFENPPQAIKGGPSTPF